MLPQELLDAHGTLSAVEGMAKDLGAVATAMLTVLKVRYHRLASLPRRASLTRASVVVCRCARSFVITSPTWGTSIGCSTNRCDCPCASTIAVLD